ncbi:hypothetical protein NXC12_CH02868 [Rhizobium etli]|uniref:Uncharacterized protein n=1 Tax=Rhizobium etli TaxID=29449 RepID=A0AAN1EKL7_RHIET|nr:hypothetical protein REMIM1_CH02828 [Rhizobium etli bv. mimosae str. Mim1]ARQ10872.1 hypothetical protein NXC12_CH02868 [Rhizobium etli]
MPAQWLLLAHVIGATVLFGTGAGIAFFMVMAHRTRDPTLIAHVAETVVIADTVFTATAALLQPVTGYLLARSIGWDLTEGWIALSLLLYVFTGVFWLLSSGSSFACVTSPALQRPRQAPCRPPISAFTAPGSLSAFRPSQPSSAFSG